MRLNLGCGNDIKHGYLNVDFFDIKHPDVLKVNLGNFPWPFKTASIEEILMLDFLEHFKYADTTKVLQEAYRVLIPKGVIDIQVPDFAECARAILEQEYHCNKCGYLYLDDEWYRVYEKCPTCNQSKFDTKYAAMKRIFGGQDHDGNFHYFSFTKELMTKILMNEGFENFQFLELNENNETYKQNWNFRVRATKKEDLW